MRIRRYQDDDLGRVEALWRACNLVAPYNDPGADIAFCQSTGHGEVFVGEDEFGEVMATVMVGHDGHRGWVYYLAVDPKHQGRGLGVRMIRHAEAWLCALGVRKVQILIRESNIGAAGFYDRLGYERSSVIVMQRWLLPPHSSEN